MDELIKFLNAMDPDEREAFATRCRTTVGYLRKARSKGQLLGEALCMRIERESGRRLRVEQLRPDVPWEVVRATQACPCGSAAADQ